ncbi:hypothetical protein AVEN_211255-1 [Araneus ventricosus]|uniref:Uncharacterized protein n=1 Tax=Araneus ventricosus TaxID=182803 RepID=A0A4Y2VC76_ARAVE|nr:hypothetical protein AVEN_211255-1 [Araneus ventricosus]
MGKITIIMILRGVKHGKTKNLLWTMRAQSLSEWLQENASNFERSGSTRWPDPWIFKASISSLEALEKPRLRNAHSLSRKSGCLNYNRYCRNM